jgi:hypothetical protein
MPWQTTPLTGRHASSGRSSIDCLSKSIRPAFAGLYCMEYSNDGPGSEPTYTSSRPLENSASTHTGVVLSSATPTASRLIAAVPPVPGTVSTIGSGASSVGARKRGWSSAAH